MDNQPDEEMNMKSSGMGLWRLSGRVIRSVVAVAMMGFVWSTPPQAGARVMSGEASESPDQTLSPYFLVKSDDSSVDQMPLKATTAEVKIAGVIADVVVTQIYKNEGKKPLETVYVFPASTRAAVYGMRMTIGERTIEARIQRREEARQAYEKAKQEGKGASLLEQHRPNVFQMNVANIMPGDEIRTELRYTELLVPADGVYEFVYPTVAGPRYSNQTAAEAPASEQWSANPYLHQGEAPPYTFELRLELTAGLPIQEMTCSSHKAKIDYVDKSRARLQLDDSERSGGNRDFILTYRLAGSRIETGLLLYEGKEENFFLMMMQPPGRVKEAELPPREYVFIVDVSGSMHGYPLDISKKLLKDLIGGLRLTDTFNVLLFAGGSELLAEKSLPATPENVLRALEVIERQRGGGGTELLPALQRALNLPRAENVSRSFVIATDGYVTLEPEAFDLIRERLGDANFFTFGIGTSVNRHLVEGMARVGAGEPFVVTKADEAPGKAEKLRQYIQSPVLTRVRVQFAGFEAYEVEPPNVPDLFAERPILLHGKWKGKAAGSIRVTGRSGNRDFDETIKVADYRPFQENSALRYLWARSRIGHLSDYNRLRVEDGRVRQITGLGLEYNLLTAYTSFVAIDSEVRREGGELSTVQQPLPLPEGVSDYAVGQAVQPMLSKSMRVAPAPGPRERAGAGESSETAGRPSSGKEIAQESLDEKKEVLTIAIEAVNVDGPLTEETVRRGIEPRMEEVRKCLEGQRSSTLAGKLVLAWDIRRDGSVRGFRIVSPRDTPDAVGKCLDRLIGRWSFSTTKAGTVTRVVLTLSLKG
jgi:Ca-activated chloride channel family protein